MGVKIKKVIILFIFLVILNSFSAVAEEVTCKIESIQKTISGSNPPAQCGGGYIDVEVSLTYRFDILDFKARDDNYFVKVS